MRRSLILDVVVRVVFHSALLLGVFLLLTGHDRPGGGFAGGLVVSAGLALHYVAGGIDQVRDVLPVRPWTLIGSGLAVAATTAIVPLLAGAGMQPCQHLNSRLKAGSACCRWLPLKGAPCPCCQQPQRHQLPKQHRRSLINWPAEQQWAAL